MANEIKLGIDIGSYKIIAVLGFYNENNKWEIVDYERIQSKGVLRGEIVDVEAVVRCVKEILNKLKQRKNTIPRETNICIGGQYTKNNKHFEYLKYDTNTEYSESILNSISALAGSPVKNTNEEDYIRLFRGIRIDRDNMEKNPIGKEGKKFTAFYNTAFGLSSSIINIKSVLANCELQLNELLLKPEAIAEIVLTHKDKSEGVVLVDLGAGTTSIIVYDEGMIQHVAIIPFGANTITADISKKFNLTLKEAEILKIKKGNAFAKYAEDRIEDIEIQGNNLKINTKDLATIIQYRLEEIFDSVLYQVQKSECSGKLNTGFVITGGGANMHNIDKLLIAKAEKNVRLGYADKDKVIGDKIDTLSLTTVLGTIARKVNNKRPLNKVSKFFKGIFN